MGGKARERVGKPEVEGRFRGRDRRGIAALYQRAKISVSVSGTAVRVTLSRALDQATPVHGSALVQNDLTFTSIELAIDPDGVRPPPAHH